MNYKKHDSTFLYVCVLMENGEGGILSQNIVFWPLFENDKSNTNDDADNTDGAAN